MTDGIVMKGKRISTFQITETDTAAAAHLQHENRKD